MTRWSEVQEGYRVTLSWSGQQQFLYLFVVWICLVLAVWRPSPHAWLIVGLAAIPLVPAVIYALRSMRHGAWIEVQSQGGYARWETTGLAPPVSPVAVARFTVNRPAPEQPEILAELLDGTKVVAICCNDIPRGTDVWAIVKRLNELLSPTEWHSE